MQEFFDEGEHRPDVRRPDTELTLGPMLLLGLFFGLLLLCGLCFGLGYSMGSRGASTAGPPSGAQASSQTAGSFAKPSASSQSISPLPQTAVADQTSSELSSANPEDNSQASSLTSAGTGSTPPVVKPALPAAATTAQPVRTASGGALMVQIATVPHQEDADVLVSALRRRGYAVTARRDPADNQFHVRTGPFSSRNEANAMRQKLLNDGYNAVVQP
jgi:cell division septation protein DedD